MLDRHQAEFSVWIEAEEWVPGSFTPGDANTDVIVTRADGSRWAATFLTYQNIHTLARKNAQTGEYLSGRYFWAADMILIEEISRSRIEEVIRELMLREEFELSFARLP